MNHSWYVRTYVHYSVFLIGYCLQNLYAIVLCAFHLVCLLASKVDLSRNTKVLQIAQKSPTFSKKYDDLQDKLHVLAARDDLLTGIITPTCIKTQCAQIKCGLIALSDTMMPYFSIPYKGQILRVAATM